ncbi:unnamed protein product [Auanema sp. JU1783]|nr:unnamed protein product [Auanema sp. JU1783]
MSHYLNNYKRFVPAASNTTSTAGSRGESLNSVPPPSQIAAPVNYNTNPLSAAKEKERQKELEYANLMYHGSKSEHKSRRRKLYDDEYLEGEDSDEEQSSSKRSTSKKAPAPEPEPQDEEDDLDAFMSEINAQASKDKAESVRKELNRKAGQDIEAPKKGMGRADLEAEDMQESMMQYLQTKQEREKEEEEIYEYDEDGNIIWTWKKVIDPLPPIDHSTIEYSEFHKNFYVEHDDIKALKKFEVYKLREELGIRVGGMDVPRPVCSFGHFGFDKGLMELIRKSEFEKPTPIQSQAIPAALSGRDVLGVAKTGSGKTAAYLWPAITHILDQPELKEGEGPIALIVVPTRELALQVYQEAKRFCKPYNINVICAYGGGNKWEQSNELMNDGAELVVCTPGRMIDHIKLENTNFLRTTFLVFDEADRMFDLGFEAQVMSISDHIRPDRQCLMFSATFKQKVERLARDALQDPVRIVQGHVGEANADILQKVEILSDRDAKWTWLTSHLIGFASEGKVLIFVTKKMDAEEVARKLRLRDIKLVLLHGDMQQAERNEHLLSFRKDIKVMVATDIAARGLDIPEIRTVINYDLARDIDTHVHRIGRTGRAGQQGTAYTLVTDKDFEMAGHLVRNLESVNQEVSEELMAIAMKSQWFQKQRNGGTKTKAQARTGLGYKPRERKTGGGGANFDPLKDTGRTVKDIMKSASQAGSATNKLQAMKAAFKSSFQSTFKASDIEPSRLLAAEASDPRPEWKKKIDEINAKIAAEKDSQFNSSSSSLSHSDKKKSRWE